MIEFIERESMKGKKPMEIIREFQQIVDDYKAGIESMDVDQLKEQEQQIIEIQQKWETILNDTQYDLPKEVANPSGVSVSRAAVGKYIGEMLNKVECEFKYALGYYQLYLWWKKPKATISYHTLDSTLHVLGSGLRFRGPAQWESILTINEYFKPLHEAYQIDNMITYLYAMVHNAIMDKMKINAPVNTEAEQGAPVIDEGIAEENPVA